MQGIRSIATPAALVFGLIAGPVLAQQPQGPQPYSVGNPLGLPVTPTADGAFGAISSNVKVYGAIYFRGEASKAPSGSTTSR